MPCVWRGAQIPKANGPLGGQANGEQTQVATWPKQFATANTETQWRRLKAEGKAHITSEFSYVRGNIKSLFSPIDVREDSDHAACLCNTDSSPKNDPVSHTFAPFGLSNHS